MEKKFKLGVIGAGFMSTAIISGIILSKKLMPSEIMVSDVNDEALLKMQSLGVSTTKDNEFLVNNAEFVLFAIKPQNLNAVLESIKNASCNKFISIMAGVKKAKIKQVFTNAFVARCMPNTPCSISSGAMGIDYSDYIDDNDVNFISSIFSSLGKVVSVNEVELNAVTGVSGSSPAYFYLFVKGVIEAGVKQGLSEEVSRQLAVNTMIGAGKMILSNPEKSIDDLINAVCSKGGTTIEAIKVYNENKLTEISEKAIIACVKRSTELENL